MNIYFLCLDYIFGLIKNIEIISCTFYLDIEILQFYFGKKITNKK